MESLLNYFLFPAPSKNEEQLEELGKRIKYLGDQQSTAISRRKKPVLSDKEPTRHPEQREVIRN